MRARGFNVAPCARAALSKMSEPSSLRQMPYWERAGAAGYGEAMYRCSEVERIRGRCWQAALDIADTLGVPADAHVLDLGCGDGAFANAMLGAIARSTGSIWPGGDPPRGRGAPRGRISSSAPSTSRRSITPPCRAMARRS
jgi:hypothetical protein